MPNFHMMTIKDLRAKWNKEKEYYKTQEVGSGVHSFVADCLKSDELFSLKEGALSTKPELRKNEYIHEKKAKEQRKADFAIYVNSDIIIPMEAECYGNIKAGIKQLFNYQKDFDKHYGILTDGFSWRFYNNNLYREFSLYQILGETEIFLEFWQGYIKPEFYYLAFFEPQGQLSLFKEVEKLPVEENRQIFFDDITELIKGFKNKLQVEGYFEGLEKRDKEKKAVEITYAYIIQFVLYKTLVDNEFGNFIDEFKEITRSIYECLKVKQYGKILGVIEGISGKISQNIYRPFKKEQDFIAQILLDLLRKPKNELHEVAPWLDIFVFVKKYNFANIQNEIFGYIYENYLKVLYEDEKKGQYFTDPAVVNFMLQQVGFTPENLQKRHQFDGNSISLIDPACGSGTFLYSAVDSIVEAFGNHSQEKSKLVEEMVNNNIFGLDIAEFPLYLAEMSILMRMLPLIISEKYNNPIDKKIKVFLTKDSVAEFMDTGLRNTFNDLTVEFKKQNLSPAQGSMFTNKLDLGYKSYVREESDLEEMKKSLENQPQVPRRRFDFVIGNPPYVGYNECSKQKVLIFELMKQDRVSLNNIYGVNLHSVPENKKKYSPKPNLYAFFIALGIALLKDDGLLCYIVPQTLLTAGDLDVLRYHLSKFTTIEKIITFSGKLFIGRGLKQNRPVATSSLVFVIKREIPPESHQVEVINCLNFEDDVNETLNNILVNKKVTKKKIFQLELLQNVANWNFIKQNKAFLDFYKEYKQNSEDISIYYNHAWAEHQFKSRFYFDGSFNIPTKDVKTEAMNVGDCWRIPRLQSDRFKVKTSGFYPRNKKIKIAEGSQGMVMLDTAYKIIWCYVNPDRFFFIEGKNILPKFQQFCIASNRKEEILYLLSVLNSQITLLLIEKLLRSENEKDILVGLSVIKNFVRVPKINDGNQPIKNEIIGRTGEMLALEDKTLSDFADFSRVLIQRFDDVVVEGNSLILRKDKKDIRLPIKENAGLVKKIIEVAYGKKELELKTQAISLSELKTLPVIDFEKQKAFKDYIDDLVFVLYFNIPIERLGVNEAVEIKRRCLKHPHYQTVSKEQR